MNEKFTTIDYRYEIGAEDYGVHEHAATKSEAWAIAENFSKNNPSLVIYVFDKMAHIGSMELWNLRDGNFYAVTYRGEK